MLLDLAEQYGGEAFTAALKRQGGQFFPGEEKLTGGIADLDGYSACKISLLPALSLAATVPA